MSAQSLLVHPAFQGRYHQHILQAFFLGTKTTEKDLSLREWTLSELKKKRERNEQFSARALHRYAASLSGTKFCAPTGVITAQKGKRTPEREPGSTTGESGRCVGAEPSTRKSAVTKKEGKEKKTGSKKAPSKKELIIAANLERKAASENAKLREQWAAHQKIVREKASGLNMRDAAELEEIMRLCRGFPELLFEVAQVYVDGCMKAWKEMKGGKSSR